MQKQDSLLAKVEPKDTLEKHLKHFSRWVQFFYYLQASGKITDIEAYEQIEKLWRDLEFTKAQLDNNN